MTPIARLLAIYRTASPLQRTSGARWYTDARNVCVTLARRYGYTEDTVAGVIAALSPRVQWVHSLARAEACLRREPARGLRNGRVKACRIRDGETPDAVLRGPKVRAFYRGCLGDTRATVIDVWMLRAFRVTTAITAAVYETLSRAILTAARILRVSATILQATVWIVVRGRAN